MKKIALLGFVLIASTTSAQEYNNANKRFVGGSSSDPLYPYTVTNYYLKNLNNDAAIIELFQQHYSAPPVKNLLNRWVLKKYNEGDYTAVVKNYFPTGYQKSECAYRASQLLLGNQQAALENIDWLWNSPKSISPLCEPVFSAWNQRLDPKLIVERARKAYYAGNSSLVSQLAEDLPQNDPNRMVFLRFSGYLNNPSSLLSEYPDGLVNSTLARDLLPTALAKLVKINSSAYASFATQFNSNLGSNKRYQEMLGKLVGYLAKRNDPQAQSVYALMPNPNNKTTESALRQPIARRDWARIRNIVNPNSDTAMGLYWLGRAQEASGSSAQSAYKRAARDRSYYGFLAADKVGQNYQFNAIQTAPNVRAQSNLDKNRSLIRAKLLANRGDDTKARREILSLVKVMSLSQKRQLTYWLHHNGFNFEAIYILGVAKDWDSIAMRFPTPFKSQVKMASRMTGTDSTWIYAIIRQESSMNPKAVSRSNAQGLMQLIPSTARMVAKKQGVSISGGSVFDPSTNTHLGAAYLADMFDRFGNIAMASAAYNAGPGRVDKWSSFGLSDMTIWVEKIPYDETRKYVKNILEYQQVYAHHLGKEIPKITDYLAGSYQATTQVNQPMFQPDNQPVVRSKALFMQ